jgi:hypothetical protein
LTRTHWKDLGIRIIRIATETRCRSVGDVHFTRVGQADRIAVRVEDVEIPRWYANREIRFAIAVEIACSQRAAEAIVRERVRTSVHEEIQ